MCLQTTAGMAALPGNSRHTRRPLIDGSCGALAPGALGQGHAVGSELALEIQKWYK